LLLRLRRLALPPKLLQKKLSKRNLMMMTTRNHLNQVSQINLTKNPTRLRKSLTKNPP
jgi:hypothetical protein